jgi:hypothetical protein
MHREVREHEGFSPPSIRTLLAIIVGEKPADIGQPWSVISLFNEPIVRDWKFGVRIGVVFTAVIKFYSMLKEGSLQLEDLARCKKGVLSLSDFGYHLASSHIY